MARLPTILTAINAGMPAAVLLLAVLSGLLEKPSTLSKALSLLALLGTLGWFVASPILAILVLRTPPPHRSPSVRFANLGLLVLWAGLAFVVLGFALLFPAPQ